MSSLVYKPPGPVARAFMLDDSFVRGMMGPVGSGKTGTCVMEMQRRWLLQEPNDKNFRRSRWAVIRNTNPMLKTTTIKTYEDWMPPEHYGDIKMAPPPYEHEVVMRLPDGSTVVAEVYFLSLDRPEDMRKLLSLELTGAFINEAREISKTIVDGVTQRLRRYPALKDGGATWSGLIMDTNAPDEDHWWPIMAGMVPPPEWMHEDEVATLVKPHNWSFHTQPGNVLEVRDEKRALVGYEVNPEGENVQNLDPKYYPEMWTGKTKPWVDVYLRNKLGSISDGRPVHGDFKREVHVSPIPLQPVPNIPLKLSADFGLTPAGHILQNVGGRYLILREIVLQDADASDLSREFNRVLAQDFPGFKVARGSGDPAGDERVGTDKETAFQVMRANQLPFYPVESNDPELRRKALGSALGRMVNGKPAILFDPSCRITITGLDTGWVYERKRTAHGGEIYADKPSKNRFSHPCEALEYGMMGEGEHRAAIGRGQGTARPVNARTTSDPLSRLRGRRANGGRARSPR